MTELDNALNEMLFEDFVEHFSPSNKRPLRIVDHHFKHEHEEEMRAIRLLGGGRQTRTRPMAAGAIWRYYKTSKRFIWGALHIPPIKTDVWRFYINSNGWGAAIKKFYVGDPNLYQTIEDWFGEFATKRPRKRWR